MGLETALLSFLPLIAKHAAWALGWALQTAAEAIVGGKVNEVLDDRLQRRAYASAVKRALAEFAREFPDLTSSFFDEHFLRNVIADELARFFIRTESPDPKRVASAYEKQFSNRYEIDISDAARRFLELADKELKKEKSLTNLLNSRQIDENNRILRGLVGGDYGIATSRSLRLPADVDANKAIAAFRVASQELLNWPTTLDGSEWLDRPELAQLLDRIGSSDSSASLLLGVPGSGKSALLSRLAAESFRRGWSVLAIRADQLPESVATLDGLRAHLELPAAIAECIAALAGKGKVLLIIDQLDALSELIDLRTSRLTVLLRLINQTRGMASVHVVSSCRSFERTYDKRLNGLDAEELHLALPSWDAVELVLRGRGLAPGSWPEEFREILRVPQCLKLFLQHFAGAREAQVFDTYQAMLERLWVQRLLDTPDHSRAHGLVLDIATEMAEREVLFVAAAKYDQRRNELEYALAAGILQFDQTRRQITFVHQTVFDFARARAFISRKEAFSQYVLRRQTAVFVRPTVWSTLNYLRGADQDAYRGELHTLWSTDGLRPHIKRLIIEFLGQQENPFDWEIRLLLPVFTDETYGPSALSAVAGRASWFAAIANHALPAAMMGSVGLAWAAVNVLGAAWEFAKPNVLELVGRFWLHNSERCSHAWYTLQRERQWGREALSLALTLVERNPISNSAIADLGSIISVSAPELAPELIGAHLRKQVDEALRTRAARPVLADDANDERSLVALMKCRNEDPLRKIVESHHEWYEVSAIAEAAPGAYLRHVWPPIRNAIEVIAVEDEREVLSYRSDHLTATMLELKEEHESAIEHPLVDSFVYAVRELARREPAEFRAFVDANQESESQTIHRLLTIGLCEMAAADPKFALRYLVGDERRLDLGNMHEDERETKMLLRALIPNLPPEDCKQIEDSILKSDPYRVLAPNREPDDRRRLLTYARQFRLRLLLQFPRDALTTGTREIVASELRIFAGFQDARHEMTVRRSESRMSAEQMARARDEDVESFLRKYPDETEWGSVFNGDGGSVEASRSFAAFARKEAARAIPIIKELEPKTHERPAAYAIRELAETELPDDELFELMVDLDRRGFAGREFREHAANALRKRVGRPPRGLPEAMAALLERWLEEFRVDTQSETAEATNETGDGSEDKTDSLLWGLGGGYTVPSGSYPILEALFFGLMSVGPIPSERLIGNLRTHLAKKDSVDVWQALAHTALPYLQHCDREAAQEFLGELFTCYPELLKAKAGQLLVARSLIWVSPDVSRRWIETVRDCSWSRAGQAYGELLALRAALIKGDDWSQEQIRHLLANFDAEASSGNGTVRGLVHAAVNLWRDVQDRDLLIKILCAGMNSRDKGVAAAAVDWFRLVDDLTLSADTGLVLFAFADGHSLEAAGAETYTLDRLSNIVDDAPDLVYRVSRRLLDLWKSDIGNVATGHALESETLLSIALTLQRHEEPHRSRGLELFELLLQYDAYRVHDALTEIDRRPGPPSVGPRAQRRRRQRRPIAWRT